MYIDVGIGGKLLFLVNSIRKFGDATLGNDIFTKSKKQPLLAKDAKIGADESLGE